MSLGVKIIILIGLIVIVVLLLLRLEKKQDKIIALIGFVFALVILFLSNVLDFKKSGIPDIDAEVLVGDLKYDSLFIKFQIKNVGTADAYDIFYIAELDNNFNYSASEKIQILKPTGEKVMLHSAIGTKYNLSKRIISPKLWIFYNIKADNKGEFFYEEFEFTLTNIKTSSETYSPTNNYSPKEIEDPNTLIKTILPLSEVFSWDSCTFFTVFHAESFNSTNVFLQGKGNEKIIWYNNFDTTINFTWQANKNELHNLKDKINVNKESKNYLLIVSWSKNIHSLQIDNHGKMTIPEIHYLDVRMKSSLTKGDIVLPITKVYPKK